MIVNAAAFSKNIKPMVSAYRADQFITTSVDCHWISMLILHALNCSLSINVQLSSGTNFSLNHLHPYMMCLSSEGSGEIVHFAQAHLNLYNIVKPV